MEATCSVGDPEGHLGIAATVLAKLETHLPKTLLFTPTVELEFSVGGDQCCFHVFARHYETHIVLGRALRNRDDVQLVAAQGTERSRDDFRYALHLLSDDGDDRNRRIAADVFYFFVR